MIECERSEASRRGDLPGAQETPLRIATASSTDTIEAIDVRQNDVSLGIPYGEAKTRRTHVSKTAHFARYLLQNLRATCSQAIRATSIDLR
jgi:hypothetical protein